MLEWVEMPERGGSDYMPKSVEDCVKNIIKDEDFKAADPDMSREEAAWAVCTDKFNKGQLGSINKKIQLDAINADEVSFENGVMHISGKLLVAGNWNGGNYTEENLSKADVSGGVGAQLTKDHSKDFDGSIGVFTEMSIEKGTIIYDAYVDDPKTVQKARTREKTLSQLGLPTKNMLGISAELTAVEQYNETSKQVELTDIKIFRGSLVLDPACPSNKCTVKTNQNKQELRELATKCEAKFMDSERRRYKKGFEGCVEAKIACAGLDKKHAEKMCNFIFWRRHWSENEFIYLFGAFNKAEDKIEFISKLERIEHGWESAKLKGGDCIKKMLSNWDKFEGGNMTDEERRDITLEGDCPDDKRDKDGKCLQDEDDKKKDCGPGKFWDKEADKCVDAESDDKPKDNADDEEKKDTEKKKKDEEKDNQDECPDGEEKNDEGECVEKKAPKKEDNASAKEVATLKKKLAKYEDAERKVLSDDISTLTGKEPKSFEDKSIGELRELKEILNDQKKHLSKELPREQAKDKIRKAKTLASRMTTGNLFDDVGDIDDN